ncbi:hypothetical protein LP7551_05407 [Roseibium album]|nr:hypothetical protein LP7551_05407 [Roseibium album]
MTTGALTPQKLTQVACKSGRDAIESPWPFDLMGY